jgi:hypothetical protein
MGDRRRRLAREDLEAMRQEFVVGERKLAPAYARALRRYLDQG